MWNMRTILAAPAALALSAALISAPLAAAQPAPPAPKAAVAAVAAPAGTSFLGVGIADIDSDRAKELKLKEPAGVEITRVEEDSPAAKAGLKVGDVVLEYNGQKVEGMEQFGRLVRETPVGREIKLLISRNGAPQTLVARIAARRGPVAVTFPHVEIPALPAVPDIPGTVMMWRATLLGIEGESLHGQLADYFGVKEGVLVRSVMPDTPAAKAGLKAGDVILKIDDSKVSSPSQITTVLRRLQDKKTVPVVVMREHKEMTMNVTVDEGRSQWDFRNPPRIVFGDRIKL
jgi:serine protease Do